MTKKTENWSRYGRVSVSRDVRGRFVHWELIKNLTGFGFGFGFGAIALS